MTIVLAQNLRVPPGSLLVSRVVCLFITSAERKVKDSRRSGMCQSYHFLTRLGMQSLWVFGFIRLFDEVRAELVRDI